MLNHVRPMVIKNKNKIKFFKMGYKFGGEAMHNIEGTLRSLAFLIQGRFKDSEFVAQSLHSALNLMKLLRDESLNPTLLGNKQSIGGLKNGRWVAYVRFIRSQSKIVDVIMTILNVIWTVQVPMEMLLTRLVSLPLKMQIIAFYEIIKTGLRSIVFIKSNFRPLPLSWAPSVSSFDSADEAEMKKENINNESKNTVLEAILTEIETSGGSQESAIKSILRDHRLDAYMLVPEQSVKPCRDRYQVSRELIRIIRPAVYSTALAISASKGGKSKWTPWVLSAMMDIYAEWPTIFDWLNDTIKFSKSKDIRLESLVKTDEPGRKSPIEQDEERKRCNRLLLYLLRDPIYSYVTEGYIDSICESLSTWTIMRPTVDTIRSYQHLIKDVQLYTLSS